jgi:hypothetical protein
MLGHIEIQGYERLIGNHDPFGIFEQRTPLAGVDLIRGAGQQIIVSRIGVARQIDAEAALQHLQESIGIVVIGQPARAKHLGDIAAIDILQQYLELFGTQGRVDTQRLLPHPGDRDRDAAVQFVAVVAQFDGRRSPQQAGIG